MPRLAGTLLALGLLAAAQSPWKPIRGIGARLWHGTRALPRAAVRDWRLTVPLVAATGALIAWGDAPLSGRIQSPALERTSRVWSDRGLLEIEPAFALLSVALEDHCLICPSTSRFALAAMITEGYTTAAVQAVKYVAGRERPYTSHDGDGGFNEGGRSFPSGHAAGAFALAELLYLHDPGASWANRVTFALAGGVTAARFTAKEHFPSDLLAGATLGLLLGRCAQACPKS
ncbi:MAG: phosphatase PAP2 family protein [Terriglobales bacterium]